MSTDWFTQPAAFGFYVGLIPALVFRFQLFLARRDIRRSESQQFGHIKSLTDAFKKVQDELTSTQAENENLRIKIHALQISPERQKMRQLEVLNRAEQRLTISAPGFAPAWQTAKNEALEQLEQEERGKSAPKQVFAQLVSSGSALFSRTKNTAPSDPA
ncbi:MAG: hypothetical protein RLZZ142_1092, partial [Verrucomicrobiota bacterium]